tara:strand:+ start:314 stop:481 length:168 start_codon:yes stop_codon:yes gene_type:complete
MLVIQVKGENMKNKRAFLFFMKKNVRAIKNSHKVLISLIVNRDGQIFKNNEIMKG